MTPDGDEKSKAESLIQIEANRDYTFLDFIRAIIRLCRNMVHDSRFWLILAMSMLVALVVTAAVIAGNPWFLLAVSLVSFYMAVVIFSNEKEKKDGRVSAPTIAVSTVFFIVFLVCFGFFFSYTSKPPANDELLDIVLYDPNPLTRKASALVLASEMDPYLIYKIREESKSNPFAEEGLRVMQDYFLQQLGNPAPKTRILSLECLGDADFSYMADICCMLLEEDGSSMVRLKALEFLSAGRLSDDTVDFLYECAELDESPEVRAGIEELLDDERLEEPASIII